MGTDPTGKSGKAQWVESANPVGFALKCMSHLEQKYKAFLLEFAALKLAWISFGISFGVPWWRWRLTARL
jgi:hypothetical protein